MLRRNKNTFLILSWNNIVKFVIANKIEISVCKKVSPCCQFKTKNIKDNFALSWTFRLSDFCDVLHSQNSKLNYLVFVPRIGNEISSQIGRNKDRDRWQTSGIGLREVRYQRVDLGLRRPTTFSRLAVTFDERKKSEGRKNEEKKKKRLL